MFVITADQIDSRSDIDRSSDLVDALNRDHTDRLLLPADQTAGDEVQVLTESAEDALDIVLDIHRLGRWSIGLGVGAIRSPLPDAVRKATGSAFIGAREAIEHAKRDDSRFALRADAPVGAIGAGDVEPLIRLLLLVRSRRTEPGWTVVDLLDAGHSQKQAAEDLGITPAAVSQRLKAALWAVEREARPALVRLLHELDVAATR